MPAGDDLRVFAPAEQLARVVKRLGPLVVERGRDHAAPPFASWIARHTRSGEAGFPMSSTPRCDSASTMELTTAGGDAIVPASPMPFTPSGFVLDGVSVRSSVIVGISIAVGTRYCVIELVVRLPLSS